MNRTPPWWIIFQSFAHEGPDKRTVPLSSGGVEGAPLVDAGKQGKHIPGHNNFIPGKSIWVSDSAGVTETQQAWLYGTQSPSAPQTKTWDAGRVVGTQGQTFVRVHITKEGLIHGYPIFPSENN